MDGAGVPAVTDDSDLVAAAAAGDQDAFRVLWNRVDRVAYGLCLRLTGNHTDAADALQEAQIAVWRNLHRFEGRCPFSAWVVAITRNAALTIVRSRGRRAESATDAVPDTGGGEFADPLVETLSVQAVLTSLPDKHREALLLWAGGLTHQQVANLMGAPVGSVKAWTHRARSAVRAQLGHATIGHGAPPSERAR